MLIFELPWKNCSLNKVISVAKTSLFFFTSVRSYVLVFSSFGIKLNFKILAISNFQNRPSIF